MYVGVIPNQPYRVVAAYGIPHVCGGDPEGIRLRWVNHWVFPMYVGVILLLTVRATVGFSIPHVCGGDPQKYAKLVPLSSYSPCMWG